MNNSFFSHFEPFPFFTHLSEKDAGLYFFLFMTLSFLCTTIVQLKTYMYESCENKNNLSGMQHYKVLSLYTLFCTLGHFLDISFLSVGPLVYVGFDLFAHLNFYYKNKMFRHEDLFAYRKVLIMTQLSLSLFFYISMVLFIGGLKFLLFYITN